MTTKGGNQLLYVTNVNTQVSALGFSRRYKNGLTLSWQEIEWYNVFANRVREMSLELMAGGCSTYRAVLSAATPATWLILWRSVRRTTLPPSPRRVCGEWRSWSVTSLSAWFFLFFLKNTIQDVSKVLADILEKLSMHASKNCPHSIRVFSACT